MDKSKKMWRQMLEREQDVIASLREKGFDTKTFPAQEAGKPDSETKTTIKQIRFKVVPYIGGTFHPPNIKISFDDAGRYFNMLWHGFRYMPEYGDGLKSDCSDDDYWSQKEFVIVSKLFMADDYEEVLLVVIPEHAFLFHFI